MTTTSSNDGFLFIGDMIDKSLTAYVTNTSVAFGSALGVIAVTCLSIWIGFYGAAMVRGESQSPLMGFSWRLSLKAVMIACACSAGIYQNSIVPAINQSSLDLIQVVSSVTSPGGAKCALNISSPMDALHCFDKSKVAVLRHFLVLNKGLDITDISMIIGNWFATIFSFLALNAFELVFGIEIIFCRASMQLLLGLGPLFIVCGAFEPTKKYFDGWMNKIVYLAILNLLIFSFFGMALSFASVVLDNLTPLPGEDLFTAWQRSGTNPLEATAVIVCGFLLFTFMGLRLASMASAITGSSGGGSGLGGFVTGLLTARIARGGIPKGGGDKNQNQGGSVSQGRNRAPSYQRAANYGRQRSSNKS